MDILAQITEQDYTSKGELPVGFLFASVKNTGNKEALVNGVPLSPGEAKAYPFVGKGYQVVPFDAKGTSLRIMYVR